LAGGMDILARSGHPVTASRAFCRGSFRRR
jgi:hypothetical protein